MSGIESVKFAKGAVIFKQGEKADAVYFVVSGGVEISKIEGQSRLLLAKLGADAVFGEMALIDSQPRSATVIALSPTECFKGTQAAFKAALDKADPAVKAAMTKLVAIIREKNVSKKAKMTQEDVAKATALKQKGEKLRQELLANNALQSKLPTVEPFLAGIYNSLWNVAFV